MDASYNTYLKLYLFCLFIIRSGENDISKKEESKYQLFSVNCTFQVFLLPLRLPLTL